MKLFVIALLALFGGQPFLHGQSAATSAPETGQSDGRGTREAAYAHRKLVRNLEQNGFFGPQTLPDSSPPVAALIPEWHPVDAAILSVHSLPAILGMPANYAQYANMISAILPVADVLLLYPEKEETLLGELIDRFEAEAGILPYQDRLSLFPAPGPTIWLRDNGPIFGRAKDGSLTALDFAARPFVEEEEIWYTTPSEIAGIEWEQETAAFAANRTRERIADATPVALMRHLNLKTANTVTLKRPPISLQGGDFIFDGGSNVFLSHETLQINGGDKDSLTAAFRRHVAPCDIHFLFPLPGSTPKHLDMVLKFVDPETVLVAEPPPPPQSKESAYMRRLRFEIESVLAFNRRYLETHFPNLRIIGVPLLPVLDEPPARILNRVRWRVIARVCELHQLRVLNLLKGNDEGTARDGTEAAVYAAIEKDLGSPNRLETLDELQSAALYYLRTDLNTFVETNVPFLTVYRSPINALQIINRKGVETFILPRFAPREGESASAMKRWESTVEMAYHNARPKAQIVWVNADAAAELQGGLHCMAITLPDIASR